MQYTTLWFLVARNIHVGADNYCKLLLLNDLQLRVEEERPIGRKRARNLERKSRKNRLSTMSASISTGAVRVGVSEFSAVPFAKPADAETVYRLGAA